MANKFGYELSKKGINIISGLARGIDTYSHIGSLMANGKTIAVLGSGLDKIYPAENKKLCKAIIENGGAIITEFPMGTKPEKTKTPPNKKRQAFTHTFLIICFLSISKFNFNQTEH